ncbi:MAG: DUF3093 family protein [Candidatus Brocadiaceae bacterium]|nr:DUF3093 family protein [Candidatus Brocadiaceae bacterium]
MAGYEHRQRGPWLWLMGLPALALIAAGVYARGMGAETSAPLAACGLLLLAVGACFAWLDVRGEPEALVAEFKPLRLFSVRVPYETMQSAERMRTRLFLHGYGMHGIPGRFAVYNTWGFDAVRIRLKKPRGLTRVRSVIVGTDDPEGLLAFLNERIGPGR